MALPSIPTSFVPYSASSATRRFRTDFTGAFGFLAYGILAIMFILAVGVFLYGRILASSQAAKDAQLAEAAAKIDQKSIESFVRLHDRLASSKGLLSRHLAPSSFFALVGTLLPTTVRFGSLHFSVSDMGIPKVDGGGVAKNFNALAAVSTMFAIDGRIKDAIFSGIAINKDGSVSFAFSATLNPKSIIFSPSSEVAPTTEATSTTPSL